MIPAGVLTLQFFKEVWAMKKLGVLTAVAVIAVAFLAAPMTTWAGGTVEGKVSFSGKPPAPKEFLFEKFPNPKFCVKRKLLEERSEEHTSELQSLAYLVCRLLLEKKKKE